MTKALAGMVLAGCALPASKLAAIEVLNGSRGSVPHRDTSAAALNAPPRATAAAGWPEPWRAGLVRTVGTSAVIRYDVTTLHFERADGDGPHKS